MKNDKPLYKHGIKKNELIKLKEYPKVKTILLKPTTKS